MYKIILAVFLFSVSLQSFSGGWTPPLDIESILIESPASGGEALIVLKGEIPTANTPGADCDSVFNRVTLDNEEGRAILSVALSAKMAGQQVKLALARPTDGCPYERPTIMSIWL